MNNFNQMFVTITVVLICALAITFIPLGVVWSLNTLFGLGIAYDFWSWLAVVFLNLTWMSKPDLSKLKNTPVN